MCIYICVIWVRRFVAIGEDVLAELVGTCFLKYMQ